jgi:transposase-like protein
VAGERVRRDLPTGEKRDEIKRLRKEVYERRRANEILTPASVLFASELDPQRPK